MKWILVCVLLLLASTVARADDTYGTCNEGTTCVLWVTLCDETAAVTDPTNCPKGGTKISTSDLTAFSFRLDSRYCAAGFELLDDTAAATSANPVKVVIPAANVLTVGKCSNAGSTCCDADADCGTGTCNKPKDDKEQLAIVTITWTYTTGTGTDRLPIRIKNLEFYPSP